jgi:hypothetical protein
VKPRQIFWLIALETAGLAGAGKLVKLWAHRTKAEGNQSLGGQIAGAVTL